MTAALMFREDLMRCEVCDRIHRVVDNECPVYWYSEYEEVE